MHLVLPDRPCRLCCALCLSVPVASHSFCCAAHVTVHACPSSEDKSLRVWGIKEDSPPACRHVFGPGDSPWNIQRLNQGWVAQTLLRPEPLVCWQPQPPRTSTQSPASCWHAPQSRTPHSLRRWQPVRSRLTTEAWTLVGQAVEGHFPGLWWEHRGSAATKLPRVGWCNETSLWNRRAANRLGNGASDHGPSAQARLNTRPSVVDTMLCGHAGRINSMQCHGVCLYVVMGVAVPCVRVEAQMTSSIVCVVFC